MSHPKQQFSLFIGRYQPLHEGHITLIRTVLDEGKNVCIGLRDTEQDENNPHSVKERINMFGNVFQNEIQSRQMVVVPLPDIIEVCHGRKVGWGIREIKLDAVTEDISATQIREAKNEPAESQGN